ncbi:MAG: FtsW/RodA/SpoVE family cell cycle protein [Candidatus Limiplasma sp.]|nr:FtsW/RodA/SpoVE family cell cycle protein [Candidatus Limiplasma sp.]
MMINESSRSRAHFDIPLTILVFGLAAFGVLSVSVATFSTHSPEEDTLLNYIVASYYGLRQAIFFLISPIVIGVITFFPYEFIRRRSTLFYYVALGLLMVALAGRAAGVKAWIDIIWGYTIQPSEFVKLACIIVTAKHLETNDDPLGTLNGTLRVALLMGIPWALTLAQGEMGSVLVMIFVFAVMLFFGGIRLRIMGGIIAAGVIGIAILYGVTMASGTGNYRLDRILSFVNPALVDASATYQVDNAKMAIGSGGMHGVGVFVQGSFSQLDYVPEDWTDFIFSTIGEAFGFVGGALLLLAYLLLILRMLYLARYTTDRFGQMTIIGVMAMMLFHIFENIGMNAGLMPVTGIPLPFISYGGSNLVTNMAGIGLVLNVTKNRSITGSARLTPQTSMRSKYLR